MNSQSQIVIMFKITFVSASLTVFLNLSSYTKRIKLFFRIILTLLIHILLIGMMVETLLVEINLISRKIILVCGFTTNSGNNVYYVFTINSYGISLFDEVTCNYSAYFINQAHLH